MSTRGGASDGGHHTMDTTLCGVLLKKSEKCGVLTVIYTDSTVEGHHTFVVSIFQFQIQHKHTRTSTTHTENYGVG